MQINQSLLSIAAAHEQNSPLSLPISLRLALISRPKRDNLHQTPPLRSTIRPVGRFVPFSRAAKARKHCPTLFLYIIGVCCSPFLLAKNRRSEYAMKKSGNQPLFPLLFCLKIRTRMSGIEKWTPNGYK